MRKVTIFLSNETKGIIFSSETTPAIQKRFMIEKLFKVKSSKYNLHQIEALTIEN